MSEGREATEQKCRHCRRRIRVMDGWWKHVLTNKSACQPDAHGRQRYIYAEPVTP